jgi:hypothetical protein
MLPLVSWKNILARGTPKRRRVTAVRKYNTFITHICRVPRYTTSGSTQKPVGEATKTHAGILHRSTRGSRYVTMGT